MISAGRRTQARAPNFAQPYRQGARTADSRLSEILNRLHWSEQGDLWAQRCSVDDFGAVTLEPFPPNCINRLTREAKKLAKTTNVRHNAALNLIAQREGCKNWQLLTRQKRLGARPCSPFARRWKKRVRDALPGADRDLLRRRRAALVNPVHVDAHEIQGIKVRQFEYNRLFRPYGGLVHN